MQRVVFVFLKDIDFAIDGKLFIDILVCAVLSGLPKAAVVTQSKGIKGAMLMNAIGVDDKDIFYTPLPLYHSAAGIIALGQTLHAGKEHHQ